jgi:hypothetical protein
MDERKPTQPLYWVNPEDRNGEPIGKDLLKAAEAIFSRVVYVTGQVLHEEARAPQILEKVVHSVWERMQNQSKGEEIINLEAYLYRSVVRELADLQAKEFRLQYGYPTEALGRIGARDEDAWVTKLNQGIQVEILLSHADQRTRALYEFWSAGDSWKTIARHLGIARGENARGLFRYGIRKAWERMLSRRRRPPEDESGSEQ